MRRPVSARANCAGDIHVSQESPARRARASACSLRAGSGPSVCTGRARTSHYARLSPRDQSARDGSVCCRWPDCHGERGRGAGTGTTTRHDCSPADDVRRQRGRGGVHRLARGFSAAQAGPRVVRTARFACPADRPARRRHRHGHTGATDGTGQRREGDAGRDRANTRQLALRAVTRNGRHGIARTGSGTRVRIRPVDPRIQLGSLDGHRPLDRWSTDQRTRQRARGGLQRLQSAIPRSGERNRRDQGTDECVVWQFCVLWSRECPDIGTPQWDANRADRRHLRQWRGCRDDRLRQRRDPGGPGAARHP